MPLHKKICSISFSSHGIQENLVLGKALDPDSLTTYSTAQFKLDSTRMQQGHDTTHFSFHTCTSLHVHARLVISNLPCKALVYALEVCTMHACMSGMHTPHMDYACMQIISQEQHK